MGAQVQSIHEVFERPVDRAIEEVIKVDALEPEQIAAEIDEYYPTASIQEQMRRVLEAYWEAYQAPTDSVGLWVSGFFGAGKSSFMKMLALLLESREVHGQDTIELFERRIDDERIPLLLRQIREHIPTRVIVFDILKDQIAGADEYPVTTVIYRALLRAFGYAYNNLDIAELELNLEANGQLEAFKDAYRARYPDTSWDSQKQMTMLARNQASAVLHDLDPSTYPRADTWAQNPAQATVAPRTLAERSLEIADRHAGGAKLLFAVDEIGQYTARDLKRISDLQGVVESLGLIGKGRLWLGATSQEKLEAIVDVYESDRSELARLQDRFSHKVFLEPSDIREVASRRVLSKRGDAEARLRDLFRRSGSKLSHLTHVTAQRELPRLDEDSFVELYPLLPYQVDLLIDIVSGLRRQASGPQTLGGANRTLIKLAQQLLIHEKVGIAHQPVGTLVTLDSVFDLLTTMISTEIHQEIDEVEASFGEGGMEHRVAKALALLQFADIVHATEENLAAVLHPAVSAESVLQEVQGAVERLVQARKLRRTEQGLKIQSAAERTWDEERDGRRITPRERDRVIKEELAELWGKAAQRPRCQLGGWRDFPAGVEVGSQELVPGDVSFVIVPLDQGADEAEEQRAVQDARSRSQSDPERIYWLLSLTRSGEEAVEERYRSDRMLSSRTSGRTPEEEQLIRDERRRLEHERSRIRSELRRSLCSGRIFFQGMDRSPSEEAKDPRAEARRVLEPAVQQIYHRFSEGGVKASDAEVKAVLQSENLSGLPAAYADLGLVETDQGRTRLVTERGPAHEVLEHVRNEAEMGHAPSGKDLEYTFTSPPYGWPLEVVKLLVATLLRDGQITLKAQGQALKEARSPEAARELTNNPRFRSLTVTVRESTLDRKKIREAAKRLDKRFGHEASALTEEGVATALRSHLVPRRAQVETARDRLRELGLPGGEVLAQGASALSEIQSGDHEEAIQAFLDSADTIERALKRAQSLEERLSDEVADMLWRARTASEQVVPVLEQELTANDEALEQANSLSSQLHKEEFFEHLGEIRSATQSVLQRFETLYKEVFDGYREAYREAADALRQSPGWHDIDPSEQERLLQPLQQHADTEPDAEPWRRPHILQTLRAERDAAEGRLDRQQQELQRLLTPEAERIAVREMLHGAIESEDELEAALSTIRERAQRALADGRSVVLV